MHQTCSPSFGASPNTIGTIKLFHRYASNMVQLVLPNSLARKVLLAVFMVGFVERFLVAAAL